MCDTAAENVSRVATRIKTFYVGRTMPAGIRNPWKSECHGGEVESKNGFEEHHSARGRSKKLIVGKANLIREGRNETLLYTLGTPADLSRKRGGIRELNDMDNPPQLPAGLRFKEIDDRRSSNRRKHDVAVQANIVIPQKYTISLVVYMPNKLEQEGVVQDDSYEHNFGRNGNGPGLMLGSPNKPRQGDGLILQTSRKLPKALRTKDRRHKGGIAAHACSKRNYSRRRAQVYIATMEASTVVRYQVERLERSGYYCSESWGGSGGWRDDVVERKAFYRCRGGIVCGGRGPVRKIDTSSSLKRVLLSRWCISVDFELTVDGCVYARALVLATWKLTPGYPTQVRARLTREVRRTKSRKDKIYVRDTTLSSAGGGGGEIRCGLEDRQARYTREPKGWRV
ncbi:hypothetical protein F5888DRAFT_1891634 [Russula emetica]|nr:hypothetical protein F5888DRAFT_1891634 [Russula emetica]